MKKFTYLLFTFICTYITCFGQENNNVLNLDGIDDYAVLDKSTFQNTRTFELWFKPSEEINSNTSKSSTTLLSTDVPWEGTQNLNEWNLAFLGKNNNATTSAPNGALRFNYITKVGIVAEVYSNNTTWNANQWYHVAIVIDENAGVAMYIDGEKQQKISTGKTTPIIENGVDIYVGNFVNRNYHFKGQIENLKAFDNAKYLDNFTPSCTKEENTSNAIGLWYFNEALENDGTIINDSSPNKKHGTINSATWQVSDLCISHFEFVLSLDGVDDYAVLDKSAFQNTRTFELWFKPSEEINSTTGNNTTLLSTDVPWEGKQNLNEWNLSFLGKNNDATTSASDGALRFNYITKVGVVAEVYSNNTTWNANQWYHVAIVIDENSGMAMYIDGQKQQKTSTGKTTPIIENGVDIYIGNFVNRNYHFKGQIENLKAFDNAKYLDNFTPSCTKEENTSNAIGLWYFNEGEGTTCLDASSNQNNGTIIGAIWNTESACNKLVTTINEIAPKTDQVTAYPNPTDGNVILSKYGKYKVINLYGQIVLEGIGNEVSMENLPTAIYIISTHEQTIRILKQ